MATPEPTVLSGPAATQPIAAAASDDAPRRGQLVGRYIVLGVIGKGAMGVVVRAYDPQLDRKLAIKLLLRTKDEISRARLVREAQTLAKLSHANVIAVFDVGSDGDNVWLAMELIEGRDLAAWLGERTRPWSEVLDVFLRAGEGLQAAHEAGIVHRDFKPANVLVSDDQRIAVGDFGLARPEHEGTSSDASDGLDPWGPAGDVALTEVGVTVGTPAYMAPEQHYGSSADARADQYAFAIALHEGLYGARPFTTRDTFELARQKSVGPPPAPESATVPRRLYAPIARALSPAPEDRFPTMAAMLAELRRVADEPRRKRRAVVAASVVLGGALIIARPWAAHAPLCTAVPGAAESVWNDARRTAIEQAMLASPVPYAAQTSSRVLVAIDDRIAAWQAARHDACAATWIRGEQSTRLLDVRMGCLDRELDRLDAQLGALAKSDAERAPQLVAALPSLARCADPSRLDDEPKTTAEARRELLAVEAALAAGRPQYAGELLAELAPRIVEQGDRALRAELELARARWRDQSGDASGATAWLRTALTEARASGHRRVEAESWILFVLLTSRTREPEHGRFYGAVAAAAIEGLAGADELAGDLALQLGVLAFAIGDDETAEIEYGRALDLRERSFGARHPKLADVLAKRAGVQLRRGERDDARASLERALAIQREAFGDAHPKVAVSLGNLGIVLADDGRWDSALAAMTEAAAILEYAYGSEHPAVANAFDSIADVHRRAGRYGEALRSFERAVEIYERTLGPDDLAIASPLLGLGQTQLELGHREDARRALERATKLVDAQPLPPVQIAETKFALARALPPEEHARARELGEAAVAIYREALQPHDDRLPEIEAWLAAQR
jgi:tetratricopeptide (TPR) repeat protein